MVKWTQGVESVYSMALIPVSGEMHDKNKQDKEISNYTHLHCRQHGPLVPH